MLLCVHLTAALEKKWKAAENMKWNQQSAHWIAGNSHGCFSHMQQSEFFLCWLCDMPNAERRVPGGGIRVFLLPCCTELDHREVQMNQVLQALVLLLMQGWCTVALVCLCVDAAWESFPAVCTHLLLMQLSLHQPQPTPTAVLSSKGPEDPTHTWELCSSIPKEVVTQKPWHSVGQHSPEGKDYILWWTARGGNCRNFIISASKILCLSNIEPRFREEHWRLTGWHWG